MRNKRNAWLFIVFLLTGAVVGGLLGGFLSQFPYLGWLSAGETFEHVFTVKPNLYVLSFLFDLTVRLNIGSVIGMISAIIVFLRTN